MGTLFAFITFTCLPVFGIPHIFGIWYFSSQTEQSILHHHTVMIPEVEVDIGNVHILLFICLLYYTLVLVTNKSIREQKLESFRVVLVSSFAQTALYPHQLYNYPGIQRCSVK